MRSLYLANLRFKTKKKNSPLPSLQNNFFFVRREIFLVGAQERKEKGEEKKSRQGNNISLLKVL